MQSPYILLALNNTELDEKVLNMAAFIAKRSGTYAKAIYAFDELAYNYTKIGTSMSIEIGTVMKECRQQAYEEDKKYMDALKEKHDFILDAKVVRGEATSVIAEELRGGDYQMVVTGAHESPHGFLETGLSCNLGLYNLVETPILTLGQDVNIPPIDSDSEIRILLTDDLDERRMVARFAKNLFELMGPSCQFKLFHVNRITKEELSIPVSLPGGFAHSDPGNAEETLKKIDKDINNELNQRFPKIPEANLTTAVVHGSPKDQILAEVEAFDPHLVVFGKHKSVHFNKLYLGRIPFKTAFKMKRPFVIVP